MKQVAVILARQSRLKPHPVAEFFISGSLLIKDYCNSL